jgi:Malonate decarboxylase gamma subunit (MdcE)/Carboxyl transferase domain
MPDSFTPAALLATLKAVTAFTPTGESVGNLTVGSGQLHGAAVLIAIVENRIASGSLGVRECDQLANLFGVVTAQKRPLLMYLDSAGARVSEGLPALGAFRHMYRAALAMTTAGAPFTVLLGTHCYGGASMLAALASRRVFSVNTQLAMSGPSILAQNAGTSALDDMFRAIAAAAIGAEARARLGAGNTLGWHEAAPVEPQPGHKRHQQLRARLPMVAQPPLRNEAVQRKDLTAIYAGGYTLREEDGIVEGEAHDAAGAITLLGIVDKKPLGAARAWALADRIWKLAIEQPARLHLLVDCETHAATLDDERVMLSSYLADVAVALATLARAGTEIETTVLGHLGGGVYVLMAAVSAKVNLLHGAAIHLLPNRAIASILGEEQAARHEINEYIGARVAERELKVGFLRT